MNVEQTFDDYVESVGGELVRKLLPKSPSFENADYLFRNQKPELVVAELKCLTKDLLKEGYQEKLNFLCEDWINRGLVSPFYGRHKFVMRDLPLECQREWSNLFKRPIKNAIAKANQQIKQTKQQFGLRDAKGLLLLVNDGNYSLESNAVLFLAEKAIGQDHSGINSIVYFTVNMTARMPGIDRNVLVWVQCPRHGIPSVSTEFLDWLREGWLKFHEIELGETVPTFTAESNQSIEHIKFTQPMKVSEKPPEPGRYYKNSEGWKYRCIKIENDKITWLRFDLPMAGKLFEAEFVQDVKYAGQYMLMTNSLDIEPLEKKYRQIEMKRRK